MPIQYLNTALYQPIYFEIEVIVQQNLGANCYKVDATLMSIIQISTAIDGNSYLLSETNITKKNNSTYYAAFFNLKN